MTDTIAAIATGLTESGIGIIRISGTESYEIAKRIFVTKSGKEPDLSESHKVHYGFIRKFSREEASDVSRETLDEVLLLNMKGPRSYTGEDTIEIDCHGGLFMMKRVLETVLSAGARAAEPGEFTKRAFLNGRLDLSQAEAVIDIINAKNNKALQASVSQLKGAVSEKIRACRALIIEDTAYIEAALDDPEHIDLDGFDEKLLKDLDAAEAVIDKLLRSADDGRLMKEGICTVILGKPNAGKSSFLNALLGEERAIVTDIAGTTRDTLEESINLRGISLNVMDTAGIRSTEDLVEKIGVDRALKAAGQADLLIYVVDSSVPLDASDEKIISFIQNCGKKTIVLMNKTDLASCINETMLREFFSEEVSVIPASMKEEQGMEQFEQLIETMFYHGTLDYNDEVYITSARQKESLIRAADALKQVRESVLNGMSEDFYSIDLMRAYTELGFIIGEEVEEDLVNEIFSKFCMGK